LGNLAQCQFGKKQALSSTRGWEFTVTTLTLGGLAGNKNLSSIFTTTSGGYSGVTALTMNPGTGAASSYSGIIANGAPGMTLTKSGGGTQTLTRANTYTGATTVTGGSLTIGSAGSLVSGNDLTVGAGGTADFQNVSQQLGAVSNSNTASNALNFSQGSGTVVLASLTGGGNTRFASNATVTGGISNGTIASLGALTANISGGTTTVGGVAIVGTMSGGTANFNGATSAITTLNGGTVNLGSGTVLTVSNGSTSDAITGSGSLTKTSVGTLTLSGTNTYSGATLVANGELLVNGSLTGTGAVTVNSGATLGGTGTIAGDVNVSGMFAPGASIGRLAVGGDLSLATGSTFAYEMNSSATPAGDLLVVNGGGVGINSVSIGTNAALTLTDLAGGMFAANTTLSLIQYMGPWNGGTFSYGANVLTNGEAFSDTYGNQWTIRYDASGGGDNFAAPLKDSHFITLSNISAVPEVTSSFTLLGLIGSGLLVRSRRRKHVAPAR